MRPPIISLVFINDTTFVNGGVTNENPVLIGILEDNTAIDISGITPKQILATLDGDSTFNVWTIIMLSERNRQRPVNFQLLIWKKANIRFS